MKTFYTTYFSLVLFSLFNLSFAAHHVDDEHKKEHTTFLARGEFMTEDRSEEIYSDPKKMGAFILNLAEKRINPTESFLDWDRMPKKANDKIEGLSETALLDAYQTMFNVFMREHDMVNAAQALWHGSLVAETKEGLFFTLLHDLGVTQDTPSLKDIEHVLASQKPLQKRPHRTT